MQTSRFLARMTNIPLTSQKTADGEDVRSDHFADAIDCILDLTESWTLSAKGERLVSAVRAEKRVEAVVAVERAAERIVNASNGACCGVPVA